MQISVWSCSGLNLALQGMTWGGSRLALLVHALNCLVWTVWGPKRRRLDDFGWFLAGDFGWKPATWGHEVSFVGASVGNVLVLEMLVGASLSVDIFIQPLVMLGYVVSLMEHCRNPLWGSSDNQAFPYFPNLCGLLRLRRLLYHACGPKLWTKIGTSVSIFKNEQNIHDKSWRIVELDVFAF